MKIYNTIYIFRSYSNQKVIFASLYFYSICLYTIPLGGVGLNLTSDILIYRNLPHYF